MPKRNEGDGVSAEAEDGPTPSGPPTPVRDLMGAAKKAPAAGREGGEGEPAPETAEFEASGVAWIAEVTGRTRSGTSPDSGAPLLYVQFRRDVDGAEPERRAWAVGRALGDLSPSRLADLLARAMPIPAEPTEAPKAPSPHPSARRRRPHRN